MSRTFDQLWMKRAKTLTQALIISGTINIGLLGTFVYFVLKDKNIATSMVVADQSHEGMAFETNEKVLQSYSSLGFSELINLLDSRDPVEEGFLKRDLALACLVAFHHFHIDQALGGSASQKRPIFFRNADATQALDVVVYPGLTEDQFEGVVLYAKTEKWPLTSKGLFFEIKRSATDVDLSLLEAFYTTPEFFSVYTFFQKVGLTIDKNVIISLLIQGDWESVSSFCEQQRLVQDFSDEKRIAFLMRYFENYSSSIAASLLTKRDEEFIVRRLSDKSLVLFLQMIADKKDVLQKIALSLLVSPRSDELRQVAANFLYILSGEPVPETYDYRQALCRFCPKALSDLDSAVQSSLEKSSAALPVIAQNPKIAAKGLSHTVQAGDCLWKISRKYKVSIERIKQVNHLESEKLKIGKELEIPSS